MDLNKINKASGLNMTATKMHYMAMLLPFMVDETKKRIKHMPFGLDGAYVNHMGDLASVVLTDIIRKNFDIQVMCHDLELDYDTQVALNNTADGLHFTSFETTCMTYATQISSLISTGPGPETIIVRGEPWPRANMPMYLEDGEAGLQYVYPIFDWTEDQLWAYVYQHQLPLPVR